MASGAGFVTVQVHTVLCECTEDELVERLTHIIVEHVVGAPEGIVPLLLAEDLVARLRADHSLYFLRELEAGG